jgi:hypothetical protein
MHSWANERLWAEMARIAHRGDHWLVGASGMPLSENNADCSRPKAGSPTAAPSGGDAQTEGE